MKQLSVLLVFLLAAPAGAGVQDDVGFTRLKTELGERLPTGKSVSVGQVESWVEVDSGDAVRGKVLTWLPNTRAHALKSYNFTDRSGAPDGVFSGHATSVARRIVGRAADQGMVSEIKRYEIYSISDWFGSGMLRSRDALPPVAGPLRVVNHSWAANARDSQILRRSDWLTDRDDIIQVAGIRNRGGKENQALLAASVNAIVVGRSDGKHSFGTPAIDATYIRGRTRPHLVAPLRTASAAAPTVTSAVVLLLDTASDPALSTRAQPSHNRNGDPIYDAGRAEVIRAVLMASADRKTDNGSNGNIVSYRDRLSNRTDNGLDRRYGAGQLNVYKAWQILSAGEQEQNIGVCGFDYEPGLAGSASTDAASASDQSRRYSIPEVPVATEMTTTLSWHLLFPYGNETHYDGSAVLNNLDLSLYEIGAGEDRLVQASNSRNETTETIHAVLMPAKRYQLVVSRADAGSLSQDYAIAWQMRAQNPER